MVKLRKRKGRSKGKQSDWFVRKRNYPSRSFSTYQLKGMAITLLRNMGLRDGDTFDSKQFQTLQDLGLTYELTGDDSFSPPVNDLSDTPKSQIQPEQRVRFVVELLNEYSINEIESSAFCTLLSSIDEGPENLKTQLIEYLLDPTPIDAQTLDEFLEEMEAPTRLIAAVTCYSFSEFADSLDGKIEGYVTPIARKGQWIYLLADEFVWDLASGLCDYPWYPSTVLDPLLPDDPLVNCETIVGDLHTAQFVRHLYTHLKGAKAAISKRVPGIVLIVPDIAVNELDDTDCLHLVSS